LKVALRELAKPEKLKKRRDQPAGTKELKKRSGETGWSAYSIGQIRRELLEVADV